jgi:hypothetical protein
MIADGPDIGCLPGRPGNNMPTRTLHLNRFSCRRPALWGAIIQQAIDVCFGDNAAAASDLIESLEYLGGPLHGSLVALDLDGVITGRDPDTECRSDPTEMLVAGAEYRQEAFRIDHCDRRAGHESPSKVWRLTVSRMRDAHHAAGCRSGCSGRL